MAKPCGRVGACARTCAVITAQGEHLDAIAGAVRSISDSFSADALPSGADVAALYGVQRAVQSAILRAVGLIDAHGVWAIDGASSPSAWLAQRGRIQQYRAARVVRDARMLRRHPDVGNALKNDAITPDAITELSQLERHRSGYFAEHAATLVDAATECDADAFHSVARQWRLLADDVLSPDQRDEKNSLDLSRGAGGAWLLEGVFDATRGAWLASALMEHSAPIDAADPRTASERRADALFAMLTGDTPIEARVDVLVDVDTLVGVDRPAAEVRAELRGAGVVDRVLLERLACTPAIGRILMRGTSEVLDVGRQVRLATRAQRRAVVARDRGCVWPGCRRPPAMCEIHHIIPWQVGGPTDLDNLALLCGSHHRRIHNGWKLSRGPDGLWSTPP